jgi:diguanylate cyclase (GGDEF)-like protein
MSQGPRRRSPLRLRRAPRTASLRSRWNRAFALLTAIVLLSGLASFLGTRLLVDTFQGAATRSERDATIVAELRAEVVAQSLVVASTLDPATPAVAEGDARIRASFAEAIAKEDDAHAQRLLEKSQAEWQKLMDGVVLPVQTADMVTRGALITVQAPKVLTLLDKAGSANRAALRVELAEAGRMERGTMAILGLLELLAVMLAVRLSRRLSIEVLRPVGKLRDSANHLAAGELDHRVVVDRADELGELAASFNAMADAIAGSQRSLTREANTDSLSGLANRAAFRTRLEATLAFPNRRAGHQAVLFVDLDDFKDVNDTLGHAAGDEVLRVVADRLLVAVRPGDLVARLGGDEFAVLLDGLPERQLALMVAGRVVTALEEPIRIGTHVAHVGASVGLVVRQDQSTLEGLMRQADAAMYAAKAKGKNRVEAYDADLDAVAIVGLALKDEVLTATAGGPQS